MFAAAIIVAAGRSTRIGEKRPKQFHVVCGKPLLAWSVGRFQQARSIYTIVLVVPEDEILYVGHDIVKKHEFSKVSRIVAGGTTRKESVLNGLEALPGDTPLVAIHDGARPLVKPTDIDSVVEVASRYKAAILARPALDALKRVTEGTIVGSIDRHELWCAQTPQVFEYELILEAHRSVRDEGEFPDDAAILESRKQCIRVVQSTGSNIKVTYPEDLQMIEAILSQEQADEA